MRCPYREGLIAAVVLATFGCEGSPDRIAVDGGEGWFKSSARVRAARRAFDGAPPVIPHVAFGAACESCHNHRGQAVPDVGYAPASPHGGTPGMAVARCRQCHVFQNTGSVFRASRFEGVRQTTAPAPRAHALAPPTIPHPVFMREDCLSCHAGTAARDEIRTTHPERTRCRQCHVEQNDAAALFPG